MAFLSIKSNPFEEYGERWDGAGDRAESAAGEAAEAASEVLLDTVLDRGHEKYSAFGEQILNKTRVMQDERGDWRVGLPEEEEDLSAEAREAEYGSLRHLRMPQPLMRTSQRRSRKKAQEVFNEVLTDALFGEA